MLAQRTHTLSGKTLARLSSDVPVMTPRTFIIAHSEEKSNIFFEGVILYGRFPETSKLDVFKSMLVEGASFSTQYEFPLLRRTEHKPEKAIPFEKASKAKDHEQWVHFYTHDRNFECVWNNPKQNLAMLQRFQGVITPDFSLYRDMPLAMQIWNTYRNRAIGYWLQRNGVPIIPNVSWGDERTYDFVFEGLPNDGTVAVSTNGCIQGKLDRYYFKKGLQKMVDVLSPATIINYRQTPADIFDSYKKLGISIVHIENFAITVRRAAV